MADHTTTLTAVEYAKERLTDLTNAAEWEHWLPALDALIAAVRAETLHGMVETQGWKHVYAALQRLAEAPPG